MRADELLVEVPALLALPTLPVVLCVWRTFILPVVSSEVQSNAADEKTSSNPVQGECCQPSVTIQPENDPLTPSPLKVSDSGISLAATLKAVLTHQCVHMLGDGRCSFIVTNL